MSALQFLNKKSWHVATLRNNEKTWLAEQRQQAEQRKIDELQKKLAEERQLEELRRMEVESGRLDPEALKKRERIDWMYEYARQESNDPEQRDEQTNEEYLTGQRSARVDARAPPDGNGTVASVVGGGDGGGGGAAGGSSLLNGFIGVLDTQAKMREDPLLAIKLEERKALQALREDPVQMYRIRRAAEERRLTDEQRRRERREKRRAQRTEEKEQRRLERRERRRRREERREARQPAGAPNAVAAERTSDGTPQRARDFADAATERREEPRSERSERPADRAGSERRQHRERRREVDLCEGERRDGSEDDRRKRRRTSDSRRHEDSHRRARHHPRSSSSSPLSSSSSVERKRDGRRDGGRRRAREERQTAPSSAIRREKVAPHAPHSGASTNGFVGGGRTGDTPVAGEFGLQGVSDGAGPPGRGGTAQDTRHAFEARRSSHAAPAGGGRISHSTPAPPMSHEEKKRRLAEMSDDTKKNEVDRQQRFARHQEESALEERALNDRRKSGDGAAAGDTFLGKVAKDALLERGAMQTTLSRSRHHLQASSDDGFRRGG